jgi:TonB family protein
MGGGGPGISGEIDYNRVFRAKEVTQKAKILVKPQPMYTEEARKEGIEGVVRVQMILSSSGKVTNIRAVSSLPYGLTEKAIAAAMKIQFEPAQKDGRKVSQYVTVEYSFQVFYSEDDPNLKTKAEIIKKPQPEYTEEARKNNVEGKVILEVILSPSKGVTHIGVKKGLTFGLTEKAMEAAKKIEFNPAVNHSGRQVSQLAIIEYVFKL